MRDAAVFFDKDGVLNHMVDRGEGFLLAGKPVRFTAPWTLAELRLYPGLVELLAEVKARGYRVIVVTNQPDVAYGVMRAQCQTEILGVVRGLGFDDVFACMHGRDEGCACRKPKAGMLHAAAKKWGLDLGRSYMLGDRETDVGAAQAAGCTSIIIDRPYNQDLKPDWRIFSHQQLLALL